MRRPSSSSISFPAKPPISKRWVFFSSVLWVFSLIYASYVYSNPLALLGFPLEVVSAKVYHLSFHSHLGIVSLLGGHSLILLVAEILALMTLTIWTLRSTRRWVVRCYCLSSLLAFVSLLFYHLCLSHSFPHELNPWIPGWLFFLGIDASVAAIALAALRSWRQRHLGTPSLIVLLCLFPLLLIGGWLSKDPLPYAYSWIEFREGLKPAEVDRIYGYVNESLEWLIQPRFQEAFAFSEGLALVTVGEWYDDKAFTAYIDRTGKIVVRLPPEFFFPRHSGFHEGLARAVQEEGSIARSGYVDKKGHWVIQPRFRAAGFFSEGLAPVSLDKDPFAPGAKYGFIDRQGDFAIPPRFDRAESFREGLALVSLRKGFPDAQFGFIDKAGNLAIAIRGEYAESFHEGLALIESEKKCGFIDTKGNFVTPLLFDGCSSLSEGLAHVQVGKKFGFIDRSGKMAIPAEFEWADDFVDGRARVNYRGCHGYIDKAGRFSRMPLKEVLMWWRVGFKYLGPDPFPDAIG